MGFDQPLLTTMYVDKPLLGIAAVQTLSRLNRMHPLKSQEDLCVLDFANKPEDIQAEFKPYFEERSLSRPTQIFSSRGKGRCWPTGCSLRLKCRHSPTRITRL